MLSRLISKIRLTSGLLGPMQTVTFMPGPREMHKLLCHASWSKHGHAVQCVIRLLDCLGQTTTKLFDCHGFTLFWQWHQGSGSQSSSGHHKLHLQRGHLKQQSGGGWLHECDWRSQLQVIDNPINAGSDKTHLPQHSSQPHPGTSVLKWVTSGILDLNLLETNI